MNKNIKLNEILKGHEGETFYCSLTGENVKFQYIIEPLIRVIRENKVNLDFCSNGGFYPNGECLLFPSKDQRDWNKWLEEQNPKVPKTWSEIVVNKHSPALGVCLSPTHDGYYKNYHYEDSHINFPIENQLLLFLKFINL